MSSPDSLKARKSVIEPTSEIVFDRIDEFMTAGASERPWQVFELTQNQDVTEWIRDPDKIQLLQPSLADLAERLSRFPAPFRVLDAGCYGGYVFDYLKRTSKTWPASFDYVGVDVQPQAIRDAEALHHQDSNAQFKEGDIFQLSRQFSPASFDVAICYRVLHHLPHFKDCLRELASVARKFIHAALPLKERSQCVRMMEKNLETGHVVYSFFRHFSREEILEAAGDLGWSVEIRSFPSTPYSTVIFSREG